MSKLKVGQKTCGIKIGLDEVVTLEFRGKDFDEPRLSKYTIPYLKTLSTRVQPNWKTKKCQN